MEFCVEYDIGRMTAQGFSTWASRDTPFSIIYRHTSGVIFEISSRIFSFIWSMVADLLTYTLLLQKPIGKSPTESGQEIMEAIWLDHLYQAIVMDTAGSNDP